MTSTQTMLPPIWLLQKLTVPMAIATYIFVWKEFIWKNWMHSKYIFCIFKSIKTHSARIRQGKLGHLSRCCLLPVQMTNFQNPGLKFPQTCERRISKFFEELLKVSFKYGIDLHIFYYFWVCFIIFWTF